MLKKRKRKISEYEDLKYHKYLSDKRLKFLIDEKIIDRLQIVNILSYCNVIDTKILNSNHRDLLKYEN